MVDERKPIHVVIADDHHMTRAGIKAILSAQDDVEVVGEASNGDDALRLVREMKPDLVVLDIEMPRMSGVEVAQRLRAERSTTRVLALSAYGEQEYVYGLLDSGASGYLMKEEADGEMIITALRGIAQEDEQWISPRLAADIIRRRGRRGREAQELSEREVDVARLAANGLDNASIADSLFISPHTVKNHVERIKGKIGVRTRAEMIAWAWHHGLGNNDGESRTRR